MSKITATYRGAEIEYDEQQNKWTFEFNGRERSCESLQAAKQCLDKPPRDARPAFARIKAWKNLSDWHSKGQFQQCEVTSIAESNYGLYVWVSAGKDRSKQRADSIYKDTAKNRELMAAITRLAAEQATLATQEHATREKLETIKDLLKE